MKIYGTILTILFLILSAISIYHSAVTIMQGRRQEDPKAGKKLFEKAALLVLLALMFLSMSLFILFRIEGFFFVVILIGTAVTALSIGMGIKENMRYH